MRPLQTERLLLRPYSPSDRDQLATVLADEEVMRHVYHGGPVAPDECEKFAEEHLSRSEADRTGFGTLFHPGWHRVIGFAGIAGCDYLGQEDYELAVVLKKVTGEPRHAKGLGTEIARALISQGFEELKLPRLLASIHPDNIGSIVLFGRLGMRFIGFQDGLGDRGPRIIYSLTNPAAHLLD